MTVERPYCDKKDLELSKSILLPPTLDLDHEVMRAAEDMDALLGFIYTLPFDTLKDHEVLLLKKINADMATGRILLQLYGEGDGDALHAYGLRLVSEAESMLMKLANGEVDLSATRDATVDLDAQRGPRILNRDEESGVDIFENAVLRSEPSYWRPGPVSG